MNKKRFRRVLPEDFDVEMLLAAAREGRLYIDESSKQVSKEQVIVEVREYVSRIRELATREYTPLVDSLWEKILANNDFVDYFMPGTKARKCQLFNKYNVMRIIGVLREKGVYEYLTDSKFNSLLEKTDKDTPYRKYLGMGIENKQLHLLKFIRGILQEKTL